MKQRLLCFAAAVLLLCSPARAAEDHAVVMSVPDIQSMEVGAKAAVVMDALTGRVLFMQNAHNRLPMASTTKIMTALIALEQADINAEFEVDSQAIRVEGSSMGLKEGDKASLQALAVGMLLASGNDGANAAAVRIAGSIPGFAQVMNERARMIGMENTSFVTPSGLDDENHYSTAYDMALLAREALLNEDFAAICSQYRMRASYGNPPYNRWLQNHNKLLGYYDGAYGIKTGFTKKSGRCLVSAARRGGVELIVVTLGCPDDWAVHQSLYDRFFGELALQDLALSMPEISVPVVGGVSASVVAESLDCAKIALPESGPDIRYELAVYPFLYAPVTRGQYVGEARIFLDEEHMFTLSLFSGRDIPLLHDYEEDWWQPIADIFSD